MASRIARFFFNQEKLSEANATYKARISEINTHNDEVQAAIASARAENKATLKTELQLNTTDFKRKLATINSKA